MAIAGYFVSVLIGVSLGLIGGGGSILTVPALVYLFGVDTALATVYSLFVVGTTSMVGSVAYLTRGLVSIRTAVVFGIPSIAAIFLTRTYIVPAIPQQLFSLGTFLVTKNILLMLIFAVLMLFASFSMIRKSKEVKDAAGEMNYFLIVLQGILVGTLTGLVGAGGGFLIIPALVNLFRMPMKTAIGTSLVIISINSLTGFFFSLPGSSIHWHFLLTISFIAFLGILLGSLFSTRIDGRKLKPAFGWFVLLMGIYIILKETIL